MNEEWEYEVRDSYALGVGVREGETFAAKEADFGLNQSHPSDVSGEVYA